VRRGLSIALREAPLALTYSEAAQPVYILRGVVAPTPLTAAGERQGSEPFSETEPRGGDA
jgi:hypothetical protein